MGLPGNIDRETLDRWCERGILGLILGILVFSPLAFGAARLQEFVIVQLLTSAALLLWLARVWLNEKPKFLFPPLGWAVLAFAGYAVGRYLTCDVEYVGRQELLRVLVYAAVFFLVLNNLHRQESTQIIAFTWFGLATLLSFYAVFQFATKSDLVWNVHSGYVGRGSGTYICPNHLAGFLEMLVPLAVAYAFVGRGKALTKIFIAYATLCMIAGIAATASRGSWVAVSLALIGLALLLLSHRSFRWPAIALLALLVLGGTLASVKTDYFKQRFNRAFVAGRVDLDTRMVLWDSAMRMWQDHVWVGVGPGHYDLRFKTYRPTSVQLQPDRAHNEYLNTLADWGSIGMGIITIALILLTVGVMKVWRHVQRDGGAFSSNTSDKFAFVLGAALGLFAMALHSVVDFNLQIPANAIVAVTLMALLTSHWRFASDRFWLSARWPGKLLATTLLLATLGYLGPQTVRLGREAILLNQATRLEKDALEQAVVLERAYTIEPRNGDTAYALGEIYRLASLEGKADYAQQAAQAITWYQRGLTNNPLNGFNYMRWGMVLDFLNRHGEAEALFLQADELDPNGYFTSAHVGQHYVEAGDYASARPWLERSLFLLRKDNPVAEVNFKIATDRLMEGAQDPLLQKLREQMRRQAD
ncbi:MAG: O-antigen ligase family protein [Verrucomicrobiota bacterium]